MKKLILYASVVCMGVLASCTKEYLVPEGELPEWLGASIYDELRNPKSLQGTFNTYLRLVDDLNYSEVLGKTGSKTIFPANDEAFAKFFAGGKNKFGKSSYEELTISEKAQLLYSSMLDNAVLVGNLSTQQNANGEMLQGKIVKHPTNISLYQSVQTLFSQYMPENNKYFAYWKNNGRAINALYDNTEAPMVHFSGEYLLNNDMTVTGDDSDFYVLTGSKYTDGDAFVFNRKVIVDNVTCQNGYIHQLDGVLVNPGNMAQMLRQNPNTHHISRMLDYFAYPAEMGATFDAQYWEYAQSFGTQDSVFAIRYLSKQSQNKKNNSPAKGIVVSDDKLLNFDPGWNYYAPTTTASAQAEIAAILAPTDKVVEDYFSGPGAYIVKNLGVPGLPFDGDNIHNTITEHLDAIYNSDPTIFTSMLNNIMKPYLSKTVPSKFATVQNDAFEFLNVTKDHVQRTAEGTYDVEIANNGVIYHMNHFFSPELYNSVLGPASVYKDMRIMGKMLNDHQSTPGTPATLEADMYYYLLSMKARYALFVPTDNENFIYIDPASVHDNDGLKALKFIWDTEGKSSFNILVQRMIFNPETGTYTVDPDLGPVAIEKGYFNTQIADMLNYHTVVLPTAEKGLYGNKYYLTKHGGAICVTDGVGSIGSSIKGGSQLDNSAVAPSTVTEIFNETSEDAQITNGSVYRLNTPIQPTVKSVYQVLSENPKYKDFVDFCEGFGDEDILYFADIIPNDATAALKESKKKQYYVFGENQVLNMLSTYNYTIYAPQDMEEAYAHGLPRWSDVMSLYETYKDFADDDPERIAAKKQVKAMVDKMHDFVLYHIQSNSVFVDKTISTVKNPTFYTNSLGIAKNVSIQQSGNNVVVNDEVTSGRESKPVIVDANILARDVTTADVSVTDVDNNTKTCQKIVSSSFVVLHGIDKPLCPNEKYAY